MISHPTTEQLERAVGVICKVIGQIPCFYLYEVYVANRFCSTESEIALKAMTHNAALDSALLNLRCFNEFFKPDGRSDDVRAYHFPDLSMEPFLTTDEEQAIHKHLAHLTVTRVDIAGKRWMLDDMTIRGLQQAVQFISFIEERFSGLTHEGHAELLGLHEIVNRLIIKIAKRHAAEGAS